MRKSIGLCFSLPAILPIAVGAAGILGASGCATAFHDAKTPSGQYCSDMPVVLNGQPDPDRAFHRIKPISTPLKSLTAPERLEALRVESCKLGGDAVINAGDEETQAPDHTVVVRASGYAIRWMNNVVKAPSLREAVGRPASIGAAAGMTPAPVAAPPAAEPEAAPAEAAPEGGAVPPSKSPATAPKKKLTK